MRTVVLVLAVAAVTVGVSAAPNREVTFFLFTAEKDAKGFTAPDYQDRQDSIKDMLPGLVKEKDIQFRRVARAEDADVIIEVLGRERDPKDDDLRTVHVRLTAGTYEQKVEGQDDDGWREAAGSATKQIRRWVYANYDQILQQRVKK
jgi:hypothetical protein